jgi:hypothetical protein
LNQSERDRDRWKSAQNSAYYSHVGPPARQDLDDVRKEYEKKIADCKRRLAVAMNDLSEYPEISQVLDDFNPEATEAEIREYTSQAKEWIDSIQPTFIDTITPQLEDPVTPYVRALSLEEGQIETFESAKRHRSITPPPDDQEKLFLFRVQQMENRMEMAVQKLEETLVFRRYTTISDTAQERLEAQHKQLGLAQASATVEEGECVVDTNVQQFMQLSARADQLGGDMEELVKSTAPVLAEAKSREEILNQLEAEHEQLKRENKSVRTLVSQHGLTHVGSRCESNILNSKDYSKRIRH